MTQQPGQGSDDRLWTIDDVSAFLGVHRRTVYRLPGIPRLRIGGSVRFDPSAVRAWAQAQKVST